MYASDDYALKQTRDWTAVLGLAFILALVVRYAWVAEDAYITLRTVDNFVNGYGLRWNTFERVQVYTHPLWMFLLSLVYSVNGQDFYGTIVLGIVCTALTVSLLLRAVARSLMHALLALTLLALSRTFIDYSTSGLENPLTHLLLVWFYAPYLNTELKPNLTRQAFAAALLACTRPDAILLCLPALIHVFALDERRFSLRARSLLLGLSPLFAWECFSLFYYGFLFPNTAYAKLNTGIAQREITKQGWLYLLGTFNWDPVSIFSAAASTGLCLRSKSTRHIMLAFGMATYLLYLVHVGGDFMLGRFYSPLVVLAALTVASFPINLSSTHALAIMIPLLALGLSSPSSTIAYHNTRNEPLIDVRGIADERQVYAEHSSLMLASRFAGLPQHDWVFDAVSSKNSQQHAAELGYNIGLKGFFSGPQARLIDVLALTDPLLARLPAKRDPTWRVGHYLRAIPHGYLETVQTGHNQIQDTALRHYYNVLSDITQGPLFSPSRWLEIIKFNLGSYDYLVNTDYYRFPFLVRVHSSRLAFQVPEGSPIKHTAVVKFEVSGVHIRLDRIRHAKSIQVQIDAGTIYEMSCLRHNKEIARRRTGFISGTGLRTISRTLPEACADEGFDALRFYPMEFDRKGGIAYLHLNK